MCFGLPSSEANPNATLVAIFRRGTKLVPPQRGHAETGWGLGFPVVATLRVDSLLGPWVGQNGLPGACSAVHGPTLHTAIWRTLRCGDRGG